MSDGRLTALLVVAAGAQLGMVWVNSGDLLATGGAFVAAMLLFVVGARIGGD